MELMYGKIFSEEEAKLNYINTTSAMLNSMNIPHKIKNRIIYFNEIYINYLPKDGEECPYLPVNEKLGMPFSVITERDIINMSRHQLQ